MSSDNPYQSPLEVPLPEAAAAVARAPTAARSTFWVFATKVATLPMSIVVSILVARRLGLSDWGRYGFLLLLGSFVLPCLSFGFGGSVVYFISSGRFRLRDVALTCLAVGLAQGLFNALVLGGMWRLGWLGETAATMPPAPMLWILASLPIQGANLILQRAVLGNSWYVTNNWLTFVSTAINGLALLGFVVLGGLGLWGAAIAVTFTQITLFLLTCATIVIREPPQLLFHGSFVRKSMDYGVKVWLADLATRANLRLDQFLLGYFAAASALGIYRVAVAVSELLWFVPDSFNFILFNKVAAQKSEAGRQALTERVHRALLLVMLVSGAALALVGSPLVRWWYGSEFTKAIGPLWILIPGTIAMTTVKIVTKYTGGSGKPGASSKIMVVGTAVSALLYVVLVPWLDYWGAAIGSTVGYACMAVVSVVIYRQMIAPARSHLFRFGGRDVEFLASQLKSTLAKTPATDGPDDAARSND